MAIVAFASLTGSPGVTTTAVATTLAWHRPALLVEADTSKTSSILPGFLRGQVDHSRGLSQLSLAQQREGLSVDNVMAQALSIAPERYLIPGFTNTAAALGTTSLWGALGAVLASLDSAGLDVLVDLGRLTPNDRRSPILQLADSVLIIARPVLPDIAGAASRIDEVRDVLTIAGHADYLNLLLIDSPLETYPPREINQVLRSNVLADLRHDPRGAAVYSLGAAEPSRFDRSPYRKSITAAQATIAQHIKDRQNRLGVRPSTTREETTA